MLSLNSCWIVLCLFAATDGAIRDSSAEDLKRRIEPLLTRHKGDVSVAIHHVEKGIRYEYRADEPMPTASLIKFPVMIEAYRQAAAERINLDEPLTLKEEDKVPGSGILTQHFTAGATLSLRDAIRLMIVYSDNTATNLVLDQVGLPSTTQTMSGMGLVNTKIHSKVFRRDTSVFPDRSKQFGLGSTTASEMVTLFLKLHQGELVSAEACKQMTSHLLACEDRTKLARGLPPGTKVAHKGGAVSKVRCDAGIIYAPKGTLIVCVMTSENVDQRWVDDNAGNLLCGEVAKRVFELFNSEQGETTTNTLLSVGDHGRLVESLQRTLNDRLALPVQIAVDGDFGPETKRALEKFQEKKNLTVTGIVDQATWKTLGVLITRDPPVPEPGEVNSQKLPRGDEDPLDGPPFVSCKAWAIGNAKTGKLLWGKSAAKPLDFASTTKIMTAYVVLTLAESNPRILEEQLTFSKAADNTIGSTAGVRAGESLSVAEALYGLLLPSGNDASVALAEHFGNRFESSEGDNSDSPLQRFISKMNSTARELSMTHTDYENPHGLTSEGHKSSAADQLKLAQAAFRLPLFRKYVGTRQRGCTLVGPGGYRRNVVWKNTNRLLQTKGYHGIKTGTTAAAGACLVSTGERQNTRLFLVVLGSASSASRYVDSRNLYRWAWKELEKQPGEDN